MNREKTLEFLEIKLEDFDTNFQGLSGQFFIPRKLWKFLEYKDEHRPSDIENAFKWMAGSILSQINTLLGGRIFAYMEIAKTLESFTKLVGKTRVKNLKLAIYEEISHRILSNSFPEFANEQNIITSNLSKIGNPRDYTSLENYLCPAAAMLIINSAWHKLDLALASDKLQEASEHIDDKIKQAKENINKNVEQITKTIIKRLDETDEFLSDTNLFLSTPADLPNKHIYIDLDTGQDDAVIELENPDAKMSTTVYTGGVNFKDWNKTGDKEKSETMHLDISKIKKWDETVQKTKLLSKDVLELQNHNDFNTNKKITLAADDDGPEIFLKEPGIGATVAIRSNSITFSQEQPTETLLTKFGPEDIDKWNQTTKELKELKKNWIIKKSEIYDIIKIEMEVIEDPHNLIPKSRIDEFNERCKFVLLRDKYVPKFSIPNVDICYDGNKYKFSSQLYFNRSAAMYVDVYEHFNYSHAKYEISKDEEEIALYVKKGTSKESPTLFSFQKLVDGYVLAYKIKLKITHPYG
uniref:HtpB n=2 Tax=Metamycoplasma arthritidis TaxID=2111 RepID=E2PTW7_METAT|nr:HtpB [Mycoplasma phage MAV1] [Metamycoplasma arthritidis]